MNSLQFLAISADFLQLFVNIDTNVFSNVRHFMCKLTDLYIEVNDRFQLVDIIEDLNDFFAFEVSDGFDSDHKVFQLFAVFNAKVWQKIESSRIASRPQRPFRQKDSIFCLFIGIP